MSERSKILLEAAQHIHKLHNNEADRGKAEGIMLAVKELRRMASEAREEHKKEEKERRSRARVSDAKWKAFGAT